MRYRCTRAVMIEGRAYQQDHEMDGKDILAGCLESCLYIGTLVPVEENKPTPVLVESAKTAAKK